jgi:SAM-dependent methyltransferase
MSAVFGSGYATSYDLLYADKDYASECDLIERLIRRYGLKPTRTILDLGCGTGNHSLPLAERGYVVVGVDRSDAMLRQLRSKTRTDATFQTGDIRSIDLGKQFDCALMMFAVLGYQLENADILSTLENARRHLLPGGILIFDVWYGPAVLHLRPSERAKVIPTEGGQLVRFASGNLDVLRQVCTVNYQVWRIQDDHVIARVDESHQMRYFFPMEIALLLKSTGFNALRLGAFPESDRDPDENTWNIVVVAQAI